jgi:hypothetical protein
MEMSIMTR